MGRRQATKELKQGIYIVGEGLTERFYFQHLKNDKNYKYTLAPHLFEQNSFYKINKIIEELFRNSKKTTVIVVFDLDVVSNDNKVKKSFDNFIKQYEHKENVILCGTKPSIEYWFLLHFVNITRELSSNEAIKELKKHINDYKKEQEYLQKDKWFNIMMKEGNMQKAIERAKNNNNENGSYSNIWKGLEKIQNK
jgi:predicted Zn-dependent protease